MDVDAIRRDLKILAGVAIPFLNATFHLNISDGVVMAAIGLITTAVAVSKWGEVALARGQAAADAVGSLQDAAAVLAPVAKP